MSFPMSVFDWAPTGGGVSGTQPVSSGLNQRAAACVHLDGTQALEVVRARHLRYEAPGSNPADPYSWPLETQSDLARIQRDHEFLRVLAGAVAKQGLGDPITDLNLINSVKADLTFDQSWSVSDMVHLVLAFHSTNINSVPQLTLPVQVVVDPEGAGGSLQYEGYHYGDVEFPSESQDLAAVDQVLGIGASTDSMTGERLPAARSVTVSVLNGTGASNQASTTAASLGALGYHVVGVGDSAPVGDVEETYVYYGSRDAATEAAAESVARSTSGSVIMGYDPTKMIDEAEVTVVTGSQFAVDPPALASGQHTHAPSTTSTSSTTLVPTAGTDSKRDPSRQSRNVQTLSMGSSDVRTRRRANGPINQLDMSIEEDPRQGERARFEDLINEVEAPLRRALVAAFGLERGREATVNALSWAWEHRARLRSVDNKVAYLYRVGQTSVRKRKAGIPFARHEPTETWFEPGLPGALAALTEKQRIAVVLIHGYQWTMREVADLLGIRVTTVQNHLERGMRGLRAAMEVPNHA